MENEIWYRGHRIIQSRDSAWSKANTVIFYANSSLSDMQSHLQRVPEISTVRHGEGAAQAIERINLREHIHGDEGAQGHELVMDVRVGDLRARLRTDEHGHASGTVRVPGEPNWDMPAEMENLADAIDLLLAFKYVREFRNDDMHPRQFSRTFYTAWVLNGRQPGMP